MLKRAFFISLMVLVVVFAVAQMGMAAYTVTFTGGSGYGPYQTNGGGEFTLQTTDPIVAYSLYATATKDQASSKPNFQSFCLEKNEYVYPWATYNAALNTAAVAGGVAPSPQPDPVSVGTADLYWRFATNDWVGTNWNSSGDISYNYTPGASRLASATDLQNAIWYLEQEIGTIAVGNNFYNYVAWKYGAPGTGFDQGAAADNAGRFAVMALNLTDNAGRAQDMLTVVPIPPAVFLLGSGFLGLVGIRRWRKK
jgi:hypothetical protein